MKTFLRRRPAAGRASHPARRRVAALLGAAAFAGLALLHAPAMATSDSYPDRPIRVIVPFPPGGGGDILARLVLTHVAAHLGQPMIFENLAGSGGNIGSQNASRATPDGYTLLYGTNGTFGINHTLYKNPGFDPVKNFIPVSQLTRIAAMVVVRPDLPVSSMKDLLALFKANPNKYTFASAGNGTTSHLAGEMLKISAGVEIRHIPYRGGGPAMTDLLGGQVDMIIDVMPSTAPQVRAGRVKGLAVSTATRVGSLPDIPTIAESGVPGFDVSAWDALFAPAGTPAPIIAKLATAVQQALAEPELQAQLVKLGAEAAPSNPDALGKYVRSEIARWGAVVRQSGASID
jgi:tripartite-type tricarboxylate transporter receptor subunit TctC